jgi:ABC-type branched-subunit amino acid transport system ATPase component
MERPPGFIQGERLVETTNLTKLYGDLPAVQDLTFALGPGEILGLVGPNGAGKTTTLRCLSGVIPPTRGRVRLAGFDLATEPIRAKSQLAFIPDEPQLFDYLTVEEHLVLPPGSMAPPVRWIGPTRCLKSWSWPANGGLWPMPCPAG